MKTPLLIAALLIGFISCNTAPDERKQDLKTKNSADGYYSLTEKVKKEPVASTEGYYLLQQKCYICHFEKPDPSKKDQMIAPPMVQVQEHYKPAFPKKEEFVNAVIAFIGHPSEEKTLMPGAVKKFNLMPQLIYEDVELRLIAETLFEYDFGSAQKSNTPLITGQLQLNEGKKWVLRKETLVRINTLVNKINNFNSTEISEYNQLGKELFNEAKFILLDKSYTGELFDQIHVFFNGIEKNMHTLIATDSKAVAHQQLTELKARFVEFENYFE